jgi:hypothetical protein
VGGGRWRVRWSTEAVREMFPDEEPLPAGGCDAAEQTLAVDPLPRAPHLEREVLLHELLHACFSNSSAVLEYAEEEKLVAVVSPRLLAALRDNPALVRYLLS